MPTKPTPFFVGGRFHGLPVPWALWEAMVIGGACATPDTVYVRTIWWKPDGASFNLYVRIGFDIDDMVAIVTYMLKHRP